LIGCTMKKRFLFVFLAFLVVFPGCARNKTLAAEIGKLASPYAFSITEWELESLSQEIDQHIRNPSAENSTDSNVVIAYFNLIAQQSGIRIKIKNIEGGFDQGDIPPLEAQLYELEEQSDEIQRQTEEILARQIALAAADLGIYNPADSYWSLKFSFPPVELRLTASPQVLVVSPLDKIEEIEALTLQPDTSLEDDIDLENAVQALGVSALVVDTGGIATYPSFVNNVYGIQTAISIASEEWFHQYMFFRPLGFRYALDELGIIRNQDIVIMNETLAGIVSGEISQMVYQRFYTGVIQTSSPVSAQAAFDFNAEMRLTRQTVDALLAEGKVDEAEQYMDQRGQFFAEHGYYIRKLNQAYFAFYGTYADVPAYENPIGADMQKLRGESVSLAAFVQEVSSFISRADLTKAVN
jgi:hypothetical protein